MVRHLPMFLEWIDIQIFLAEGICLWSSTNLMVETFLLQIKQLIIVPLCVLKCPDTSTLNASFFSRLFLLFYFFVYFILTIKFCFSLQSLFGKEADKLEQANDDDKTCILCLIRSITLCSLLCQFKPVAVLLLLLTSLSSLLKLPNEE